MATIYPAISPIRMEEILKKPVNIWRIKIIVKKTKSAINRFFIEPNSGVCSRPTPPPTNLMPTGISEIPKVVTTVPVTTWGRNLRSGFTINPSINSIKPPMRDAPRIAAYPFDQSPIAAYCSPTPIATGIKPELVPITVGSPEPIFQIGLSCTNVTAPATNIALCSRETLISAGTLRTPVITRIGARFPAYIAKTCCIPSGIAVFNGTRPSSL